MIRPEQKHGMGTESSMGTATSEIRDDMLPNRRFMGDTGPALRAYVGAPQPERWVA